MSFHTCLYKLTRNRTHRKENDSFLTHHLQDDYSSIPTKERASAFTSKGSITLEAALALSLFFFAILSLVYLFEIMAIQTKVKSALHSVGREVAQEAYLNPVIPTTKMERRMGAILGEERLEDSLIVNGSHGFDCSASKRYGNTTIMDLTVTYQMKVPVLLFQIPIISKKETIRVKGWTGYEVSFQDASENTIVYVTDYGMVYHADMHCHYLDLSIRAVEERELEDLRNQSGGIYKKCPSCAHSATTDSKVYITDYGEKYHKSLECSGLKRNIYAIPLRDVQGLGGCSKCVK